MRHELHFAVKMHFVWEAVKLFETIIPTFSAYTTFISLANIVTHLNVWAAVYTSQHLENTCNTCLNVGNDSNLLYNNLFIVNVSDH